MKMYCAQLVPELTLSVLYVRSKQMQGVVLHVRIQPKMELIVTGLTSVGCVQGRPSAHNNSVYHSPAGCQQGYHLQAYHKGCAKSTIMHCAG